ncbi:uncharacterized protein LDX57_001894 [Aspergillus melleus]|uniref:uncharacterized protein n=1 Tax=Aspergillus melleus TaxID=138277 RepID=UPI001E8EE1B6|nr:uncharacterized protein LDX57_001894 [Aspergillus melleus]KAH8424140.1 hypothetical protein LDX57_001894 [Aspergillus melleus]
MYTLSRAKAFPAVLSKPTVAGLPSDDDMGVVSVLVFFGMLEMGVALVAICLPIMYRLLRKFSPWSILQSSKSVVKLSSRWTSRGERGTGHDITAPS